MKRGIPRKKNYGKMSWIIVSKSSSRGSAREVLDWDDSDLLDLRRCAAIQSICTPSFVLDVEFVVLA